MEQPPTETPRDNAIAAARALVKGAVGAVPVAGSFLAEIIDLLYRQPIEERRQQWLSDVAQALSDLKNRSGHIWSPEDVLVFSTGIAA